MMSETVVTVHDGTNNANNPRQGPTIKTEPGQPGLVVGLITFNGLYFKTIPGIIKLVQLVLGIICMACAAPAYIPGTSWFLFVAIVSFIATLIWVFIYLLSIREALKLPIKWILSELINTGIATVLYTIAFIVQLSVWSSHFRNDVFGIRSSNIAAGVFGIFNTIAYAAGTYFLYIEWKNNGSSGTGNSA
ncbi:CKLF-like MARVEL transmembrane domain-containing protein 8 [Chelonus insularis]|uniref:CKLF-like MARVEL transmembrane domain-containing protein 8 n=1 Tax=Chelonus insularis TaxID=460826 RepID=UPI00158CCB2E|nr:CKLF-like MARVEL transmembrane domain-containing protein 8 [Chelonus insularis]